MKPETVYAIAQDRPATRDEIRLATSSTPDAVLEFWCTQGTHCEIDSELGGTIRYPADEFEFFAYLSETQVSAVN